MEQSLTDKKTIIAEKAENGMKKSKKIFGLVIISICLAMAICLIQLNNYFMKMLSSSSNAQDFATYSIQHESNPLNKDMQCFIDLYNNLIPDQHDEYAYYELYLQFLENSAENLKFYSAQTNELTESCFMIKAIQISENVIRDFNITVSEGNLYDQSDYIYEQDGAIPILMGDAYSSIYNVGDTFVFTYLYDDYLFEVIGFLEKGSKVALGGKGALLDTYIVMPSFNIRDNVSITNGLKIHYANKTSGIVKINKDKANLFYTDIEPLLSAAHVGEYSWIIEPFDLYFKDIFGISIFIFMGIIYLICLILLIIMGLIIRKLNKVKEESSKRFYEITNAVVIFGFTSSVYLLINFIYTFVLGIIIIKTISFLIIGIASICISIYINGQIQGRREKVKDI